MNFTDFPKVELHLHLDCSLSFDVVTKIDPTISFDNYCDKFIAPSKCTDLADFLTRAPQGVRLMQSEHELQLVVNDLFEQLQRDNIIYAEIRFAPLQHESGLSVGINTDGRTISNINLSEEYQKLHRVFGWSREHFLRCNLNAIRSSFIPEHLKLSLSDRLKAAYQNL